MDAPLCSTSQRSSVAAEQPPAPVVARPTVPTLECPQRHHTTASNNNNNNKGEGNEQHSDGVVSVARSQSATVAPHNEQWATLIG